MDTELLRTFLEVERTRHFGRAANNLFITSSAVGARIRLLEEMLGTPLFARKRYALEPTPAGARLKQHAETILASWNRARQELSAAGSGAVAFRIAAETNLWDVLLQDWVQKVYTEEPDLLLSLETLGIDSLQRRLLDRSLDLVFMLQMPRVAGLQARKIADIELRLFAAPARHASQQAPQSGYFMVDWGTALASEHAEKFVNAAQPGMRVGAARIAHAMLLHCGGSAYLATRSVQDDLQAGRLHPVAEVPQFNCEVFAVFRDDLGRDEVLARLARHLPVWCAV